MKESTMKTIRIIILSIILISIAVTVCIADRYVHADVYTTIKGGSK